MQTKALIAALEQFRDKAKGSPAKSGGFTGQKGVFDKAMQALAPFGDMELAEALAALEASNQPKARKSGQASKKPAPKAKAPKATLNSTKVQSYIGELEAALISGGFDATRPILDRLAADKAVKVGEMRAICSAFVGSSASSRKDALARIEQSVRSRILKR